MAIISKGIKLSYKTSGETYTDLTNLQEIPELGGSADSLETTVLSDAAHTYTNGILNYGDSIAFKFLYETNQFSTLGALVGNVDWKVTLPDDTTCTFSGTGSVSLDGVGINAVLTYTLNIKPNTAMVWD